MVMMVTAIFTVSAGSWSVPVTPAGTRPELMALTLERMPYKVLFGFYRVSLLTLAIICCTSFSYVLLRLIGKHDRIRTAPYMAFFPMSTPSAPERVPAGVTGTLQLPAETVKMAVTIITIGPIIFLYPFIQKYFVSGVMSGAVKE